MKCSSELRPLHSYRTLVLPFFRVLQLVKDLLLRTQMALMSLRRIANFTPAVNFHSLSRMLCFSSSRTFFDNGNGGGATQSSLINNEGIGIASSGVHLSPLLSRGTAHLQGCRIELVDDEAWQLSSGLAEAWRGRNRAPEGTGLVTEAVDEEMVTSSLPSEDDPNFDEIDDMRIRGSLFYKIDRDSKEFEEYSFDFHGRKQSKNKQNRKEREKNSKRKLACEAEKSSKNKEEQKETRKRENASYDSITEGKGLPKLLKNEVLNSSLHEMDSSCGRKRERAPTFNQLTAPYHEPFCLDIYLTKGSVRACIIHRATSKVVAVAHSISKDMKFDLSSVRNATACAAVGHVLAQRALADDIHNVVYTPRKGEKLEGKLQIVLQSIIDNGVNVKVKIKQRKVKKGTRSPLP